MKRAPLKRTPMARSDALYVKKAKKKARRMKTARSLVEKRCEGLCEAQTPRCTGYFEHAHHVVMRSQGGADHDSNLMATCAPCHTYIHANPKVSYAEGWLKSSMRMNP